MKKIPYHRQTSTVSCGPASLLMIINYLNTKYGISREEEWELWREIGLMVWRGTGPFGMALGALKKGLKVTLVRKKKTIWRDFKKPKNNEALRYVFKKQEKEARKLGLKVKIKKDIDSSDLKKYLKRNVNPIFLIRFIKKNKRLGRSTHWIVLNKIEKNHVIIHDPWVSKNRKLPLKVFLKAWDKCEDPKQGFTKEVILIQK